MTIINKHHHLFVEQRYAISLQN